MACRADEMVAGAPSSATLRRAATAGPLLAPLVGVGSPPVNRRASAELRCFPTCVTHNFENVMTASTRWGAVQPCKAAAWVCRSFDSISSIDEKLPPSLLATLWASFGHFRIATTDCSWIICPQASIRDESELPRTSTGPAR